MNSVSNRIKCGENESFDKRQNADSTVHENNLNTTKLISLWKYTRNNQVFSFILLLSSVLVLCCFCVRWSFGFAVVVFVGVVALRQDDFNIKAMT